MFEQGVAVVGYLCARRWPGGAPAGTGKTPGAGGERLTRLVQAPARGNGCAVDMVRALLPGEGARAVEGEL